MSSMDQDSDPLSSGMAAPDSDAVMNHREPSMGTTGDEAADEASSHEAAQYVQNLDVLC